MASVSIDDLADALVEAVKTYTDDVTAAIEEATTKTADAVLREVEHLAPKRTGEYAKRFVKTRRKLPGGLAYTIWNRKHYRRVHLLEFGHAKVGGGRVEGRPHMRPALDKHAPEFERRIEQIIERGS